MSELIELGQKAKEASRQIATLTTAKKDAALLAIADGLIARADEIIAQNEIDVAQARAGGMRESMVDRLLLNPKRIEQLAQDTRQVATLPDPVGSAIDSRLLPNGLRLTRRRIPIGVVGVIYESRPNVTIDISTLCLKTGNAVILRGSSSAFHTNRVLTQVIQTALAESGLPMGAVQYIENTDRAVVREFLRLDQYVDMIVPRGGHSLHKLCREEASVPVITGGIGICHIFVDQSADLVRALDIIENSKIQKPGACNSLDTILVHQNVAGAFIAQVAQRLAQSGVKIHAHGLAYEMLANIGPDVTVIEGQPTDFDQEWLDLIVNIQIVSGVDETIAHIQRYSMEHSDSILTNDWHNAEKFVNEVNSSAVFVNASTRFNDGGQFGLGAEVAISTQKLHARGPMGLTELTTYKWICVGDGHIR